MTSQDDLRALWLEAPEGKLCGREQAKAWALREVWRSEGKSDYGMCTYIASKLKKTANGRPTGAAPGVSAVKEFFDKIDIDPDWFPGNANGTRGGPRRVLRGAKVTAIVSAAKRLKAEGEEPTYPAILAARPRATLNPSTNEPVDKHLVYAVFRECCYDDDPADTWDHLPRLSQSALDLPAKERRLVFANHMLRLRHTANWFYMNIVWVDLCRSVCQEPEESRSSGVSSEGYEGVAKQGLAAEFYEQAQASEYRQACELRYSGGLACADAHSREVAHRTAPRQFPGRDRRRRCGHGRKSSGRVEPPLPRGHTASDLVQRSR